MTSAITWQDLVEPYIKVGTGSANRPDAPAARKEVEFWICPSIGNTSLPKQPGDPDPGPFDAAFYTRSMSYINNGNPCRREVEADFLMKTGKKYWRLQAIDNPCDVAADYVDLFPR